MTTVWLLAALVPVAAANWWSRWTADDALERWTKPVVTVLAIAIAATSGASGAAVACGVVALVLCLAGDVALLPAVNSFLAGLGAFLLGHLAFVPMLVLLGLEQPWLALVAVALLVPVHTRFGWRIVAGANRTDPGLRSPVSAYLVVISAMAVVAWATGNVAATVGAAAFVASDTILGWRKFVGRSRWMGAAIMVTYHVAIVGLALSLVIDT